MRIRVNGSFREVAPETTIADLLASIGLGAASGVAVAIGRAVIPRPEHRRRILADGEEIEVIRAVGGG